MAKAGQFYNTLTQQWSQPNLDISHYTLDVGQYANKFITHKASDDNLWILALRSDFGYIGRVINISKTGTVTSGKLNWTSAYCPSVSDGIVGFYPQRDGKLWFCCYDGITDVKLFELDKFFSDGATITQPASIFTLTGSSKIGFYKDLYIWVASGTTVKIYDYTTKAELSSYAISSSYPITGVVCDANNVFYITRTGISASILKYDFNGISSMKQTVICNNSISNSKQLLIDPFGDLIILTNSDTASTLLKYTTAGVQIGAAVTLDNPSYNLNIGKLKDDGSYKLYYQTALKTFSVNNTTAHAEIPALVNHVEIRGTGNAGFGSNYTGQQPSVYA